MNRLSVAARRLRGILALSLASIIASVGVATPAVASSEHSVTIRGTAACDTAAGEWVVTWTLTNRSDVPGTLGNVRAYPPGRPLVGMPNRVQPGDTITGIQRTLASEYTASLELDVNWDDGPVTYNHHWPTFIRSFCPSA